MVRKTTSTRTSPTEWIPEHFADQRLLTPFLAFLSGIRTLVAGLILVALIPNLTLEQFSGSALSMRPGRPPRIRLTKAPDRPNPRFPPQSSHRLLCSKPRPAGT